MATVEPGWISLAASSAEITLGGMEWLRPVGRESDDRRLIRFLLGQKKRMNRWAGRKRPSQRFLVSAALVQTICWTSTQARLAEDSRPFSANCTPLAPSRSDQRKGSSLT